MGGDHAPEAVVRGVAQVSLEARQLQAILVGDAARIARRLTGRSPAPVDQPA